MALAPFVRGPCASRVAFAAAQTQVFRSHLYWRRAASSASRFQSDPRLASVQAPVKEGTGPVGTLQQLVTVLRIHDFVTPQIEVLLEDRQFDNNHLMERFHIPPHENFDFQKSLHWKTQPKNTAYATIKLQSYWLTLHTWLLHSKQMEVQDKGPGLLGVASGGLIEKRMFDWSWSQVQFWMHCADVPGMSLKMEVSDMQFHMFNFCDALDKAFAEDAPEGVSRALAAANSPLGPRVIDVLVENVYSGAAKKDADFVYDLAVYVLRQRIALEAVPTDAFLSCGFSWADFTWQ